jgi:uncharacterized protein YndB with AHSA1/START domain
MRLRQAAVAQLCRSDVGTEKTVWTYENSIETSARPARVWRIFADVNRWKDWNAGIASIQIHGPFAAGTRFSMQPPGQEPFVSTLIDVKPGEVFTDETLVDQTRVLVHHRLVALPSGRTKIIYSTEITGPDAADVGLMVTADFPTVLAALKQLAEQE